MEIQPDDKSISDLLFEMRSKGVKLWSENGILRYKAPKGRISAEENETIRARKHEIVNFLQRKSAAAIGDIRLGARKIYSPAPVTPCQRWRLEQLYPTYSRRTVFPVRLLGNVNVEALQQTFERLAQRHESLRTHFLRIGSEVWQNIHAGVDPNFDMIDLGGVSPGDRMAEINRIITQFYEEKIDVSAYPLFKGTLIKLEKTEHTLLIHGHDCILDATSFRILWKELWAIYVSAVENRPTSLPDIPVQLPDFSVWLQETDVFWKERHEKYWLDRLESAERVRLFAAGHALSGTECRIDTFAFQIGAEVTTGLRKISRESRTSLGMVVLTAWAAMVLRLVEKTDIVLSYLTSGRMHPDVENAIGCFMCPLYLRIKIEKNDNFLDLMTRISDEYSTAYGHHDFGRLLTRRPEIECVANPMLNWLPRGVFLDAATVLEGTGPNGESHHLKIDSFEYRPTLRDDVRWDLEPCLALLEGEEQIWGKIYYRTDRIRRHNVELIAENVRQFTSFLQQSPTARVASVQCLKEISAAGGC